MSPRAVDHRRDVERTGPRRSSATGPAGHPLLRLQRTAGNQATTLFVQREKTLTGDMSPSGVDSAIRNTANRQEDAVGKHAWIRKDAYVSNWDHPAKPKGMASTWGFSTAHWLSDAAKWVVHVHRNAGGSIASKGAANVQAADMEGKGGTKDSLTAKQIERIGIPATETPSPYVKRRWTQLGKSS